MELPWDSYTNATLEADCASYFIPEAALLWCNVPEEKIPYIIERSIPLTPHPDSPGEVWMNHNISCLKDATQKITNAIDDGDLPWELDHSMTTPIDGGHRLPVRKRILRRELKKWMSHKFPDDKPAFLFDDAESNTNSAISADVHRALEAERDDLGKRLEKADEANQKLKEGNESAEAERDSLKKRLAELDEPSDQSKKTYLNIIAALLGCVRGKPSGLAEQIPFDTDGKLIKEIAKFYRGYYGLSESTLSHKFPKARRSLKNL